MRSQLVALWCGLAIVAATGACEKASPTRPTEATTVATPAETTMDAATGVTIVAARPVSPANRTDIPHLQQPITLTVNNGVTTGSAALTYTFQVSTDATFARTDVTKDNVAAGANGTTSVTLGTLAGGKTYYWRAQVNAGSLAGPYSTVWSFNVGPEVILGNPTVASPVNGAQLSPPVTLVVNNISRTGPAGPIVYTFEVSTSNTFSPIIYTADVAERSGAQTSLTGPSTGMVDGQTYYWRAKAADSTNKLTTAYSNTGSFSIQTFDIRTAKFWDNPPDAGTWPIGAKITLLEFTGSSMRVDFDRREGPNRWPDVVPPGFSGPLQYTLGMCRKIDGSWHCSAVVQFWYGRDLDSTAPASRFWREWWYDSARWGPLASNPPVEGELVGVFVAAGDLRMRSFTQATCPRVCEISNVVLVPFTSGYAKYEY